MRSTNAMRVRMGPGGLARRAVVVGSLAGGLVALAMLGGCDRAQPSPTGSGNSASSGTAKSQADRQPDGNADALPAPDASYTTKGRVVALADPSRRGAHLVIHHEEIPELLNAKGEKVGMPSHAMEFPWVTADVSSLAVGDVVEITFDVRWKHEQRWVLSRVAKLPAETPLSLKGE